MPACPSPLYPLFRCVLAVGACLAMTVFPPGGMAADEGEAAPKPAERIKQLQDEAENMRAQAEAHYQATETACYKRFLVNSCIDKAKAERLAAIRHARELEAEAHQIDLAERQRKAAEAAKKAEEQGSSQNPMGVSSPSADMEDVAQPTPKAATPPRRVVRRSTASSSERVARDRARAVRRAETARRDRERYDARIRELEEKKARDADGR